MMYRCGNGVKQSFEEAFIWLSIGANNGHPECQCNLASMYLDGDGVPESIDEGAEWVNLAFKQGCEDAAEMIDEYELWDDVDGWYEWKNSQQ
jgi:TPR repeat protein